ncbi:MAG: GNAT family N-acetyltransferase [Anaerolineales bacterium]
MATDALTVEPASPGDREAVIAIAAATAVFSAEEIITVAELFDGYLLDPEASGYNFLTAWDSAGVLGFACWGPADLSRGAADLYWIATAPQAQGRGVAAALFRAVEEAVAAAGRWVISIWTSSLDAYAPARRFYLRMGAVLAAQVKDYYDRGEDLCIYTRHL